MPIACSFSDNQIIAGATTSIIGAAAKKKAFFISSRASFIFSDNSIWRSVNAPNSFCCLTSSSTAPEPCCRSMIVPVSNPSLRPKPIAADLSIPSNLTANSGSISSAVFMCPVVSSIDKPSSSKKGFIRLFPVTSICAKLVVRVVKEPLNPSMLPPERDTASPQA